MDSIVRKWQSEKGCEIAKNQSVQRAWLVSTEILAVAQLCCEQVQHIYRIEIQLICGLSSAFNKRLHSASSLLQEVDVVEEGQLRCVPVMSDCIVVGRVEPQQVQLGMKLLGKGMWLD